MAKMQDLRTGTWYSLPARGTFAVGRSSAADLPLLDRTCSREQFCIVIDDAIGFLLRPLSTTSPTLCEEIPIYSDVLLDRDVQITAGQSKFLFVLS